VLDYSTDVGPFTIVDQSGEGNTATLYSGRGLTMDAVNDTVTYATGYSSASRTATLWGKFNTTSPVALLGSVSGFFVFYPTTTGVWEELTSTATVEGDLAWDLGLDFDIGDLRVDTEHWTHNDWSDPTGDTSNGKTIVDSGPNQLHGTCTGCSGFTGEATIPQTADNNWNKYQWFNGTDTSVGLGAGDPLGFHGSAKIEWRGYIYVTGTAPLATSKNAFSTFINSTTAGFSVSLKTANTLRVAGRSVAADSFHNYVVAISDGLHYVKCYADFANDEFGISIDEAAYTTQSATFSRNTYKFVSSTNPTQIGAADGANGWDSTLTNISILKDDLFTNSYTGLGNDPWADTIGSNDGTETGTFTRELVTASDANIQIDALGTAILEPRTNTQVVNLFGEVELVTTPAAASLDTIKTVSGWIWHDATARTVFDLGTPTVGTTTTALTSSGFTGVTYFVNGASGTTLSAGWNHCVVASTAALATDDIDTLAKSGSQIDYDVTLTAAEALANYDAQKSNYGYIGPQPMLTPSDFTITTVADSPTPATIFYGTPNVTMLSGGRLLAKLDEFGSAGHTNGTDLDRTKLYTSDDDGATWQFLANFDGMYWSRFVLGADGLYLVGVDHRYGTPCVAKSDDGGATWSTPVLIESGSDWHCSGQPNISRDGVAYFSLERNIGRAYPIQDAYVISCPLNDLLNPGAWETSNAVTANPATYPGTVWGWSEGNIVENLDGDMENWLRVDIAAPAGGEVSDRSMLSVSDTLVASFTDIIGFDAGYTNFALWKDSVTGDYFCARNSDPVGDGKDRRTKVVIDRSSDMISWRRIAVVVELPVGDYLTAGVQYTSVKVDGDDLHLVIRTADKGVASNYHDANRITYTKMDNFRSH